jgi:superfamily I DNA/RNA helicase
VAVTRAKEQLHFIAPKFRSVYDGGFFECEQSRFLREIPRELLRFEAAKFAGFSPSSQQRRW